MLMKKQFQSKSVPRGTRTIWRYLGALFILFTFAIGNVWAADETVTIGSKSSGAFTISGTSHEVAGGSGGTSSQTLTNASDGFSASGGSKMGSTSNIGSKLSSKNHIRFTVAAGETVRFYYYQTSGSDKTSTFATSDYSQSTAYYHGATEYVAAAKNALYFVDFVFAKAGTYAISLTAGTSVYMAGLKFTAGSTPAADTYTVKFMDGTTELGTESVKVGSKPTASSINKNKDFYTFEAWQLSGVDKLLTDDSWKSVAKDATVTLTARYSGPTTYSSSATLISADVVSNKPNVNTVLAASNIVSSITFATGQYEFKDNTSKPGYYGYKVNTANDKITLLVKQGKRVKVLFGSLKNVPTIKVNNVSKSLDADRAEGNTAENTFTYTATGEDALVSITFGSGTSTLKKVDIYSLYNATYTTSKSSVDPTSASNVTEVTLPTPSETTVGGYSFTGWVADKTVYKGETAKTAGEGLDAGGTYTLTATTAFTAQWVQLYAVTYDNNGGDGIMTDSNSPYAEGAEVTLLDNTFTAPTNKIFGSWVATYNDGTEKTLTITNGKFTMPAYNVTVTAQWVDDNKVAKIGETYYTSLEGAEGAFANVSDGQTIELLKNCDVTSQLEIAAGVTATIDLAGYKIEYTGSTTLTSGVILVHNGASLTINDSSDPSAGSIVSGDKAYAAVALTKLGDDASNPATLVVNGGALTGYYYGITGNGSRNNTDITINGGTITGTVGIAIYHPQVGTLTVNDGSLTGVDAAIEMRAGTLVINDGTFTATATVFSCDPNGSGSTTSGAAIAIAQHTTKKDINVTINGGTFNGVKALNESNPQVNDPAPQVTMAVTAGTFTGEVTTVDVNNFISGGTFDHEVAANQCAEGYAPKDNGDNTYGVKPLAQTFSLEDLVTAQGTGANYTTYLNNLGWTVANADALDNLNTDKPYNNYPYLGLKFKNEAGYVAGEVEGGKLLTIKLGHMAGVAHLMVDDVKKMELDGVDAETPKVHYYYVENTANVKLLMANAGSKQTCVLKAMTVSDPFTVTFDANGGGEVASLNGTPSVTLPSTTKGTESFLGWFTEATGGEKIGDAGDSYTPTADITLHAQWEAVSTDARLASITFSSDAGTLSPAFDPEVTNYTYTMPYGTAAVPTITGATKANPAAKDPVIDAQAASWGETAHVHGVAASDDTKDYYVQMLRAPKDGVSLVKIEPTSQTKGTQTGLYPNGDELTINLSSGMNLGGSGKYIGVKATENFQEGDVLHLDLTAKPNTSGSTQIILYAEKEATNEVWATGELASEAKDYYLTLPAAVNGHNELYIVRTEGNKWNGGPSVMEVTRAMNPMLTAMTIDGRTVTINEAAKTATVTIPYEADLAALTITKTIVWNAPATENSIVVNDGSAWVIGDNTYKLTDKDGDATTYTITVARDVLKHTVSFNTHGGSAVASVEVVHNEYLTAVPNEPSKEDYIFQYWSLTDGGEEVDITAVQITENKEFHAVWAPDGAIKLINKTSGAVNEDGYFITGVTATEANSEKAAAWGGTQGATISGTNQLGKIVQYNATTNQTKLQIKVYNTNNSEKYVYIHKIIEGNTTEETVETLTATSKTVVTSEYYEFNNTKNRSFYITTNSTDVKILQVKVIESGETPMKQAGEAGYSLNLNKGRALYYANSDVTLEGLALQSASNYSVISSSEFQTTKNISFSISSPVLLKVTTNTAKYYVSQDPNEDGTTATAITAAGTAEFELTETTNPWYLVPSTTSNVKYTNIAFELPKAEAPVIETQPQTKLTFDPGNNLTATVVAAEPTDGGTLSYQWYDENDEKVDGATVATLTTTTPGTYYVVVTNTLAGHQDVSVTSDEAELGYRVTDDATLMALSYGGTAITLEDGVYDYNVELAKGTTDVPALAATATMNGYATVTISNAAEFVSYAATSTVTVKSEDLTVTNVYTVNFYVKYDLPQVDVTATTTWNWANAATTMQKIVPAAKNVEQLMANIDDEGKKLKNDAEFNSQALIFSGQEALVGNSTRWYAKGGHIKFNVTVPGIVKVEFSDNGTNDRRLKINNYVSTESSASETDVKTYAAYVQPGEVTLMGVKNDGTGTDQYIRISKITFTANPEADYTRNVSNNIGTLCVDHNVLAGGALGATFYQIASRNEQYNDKIDFEEVLPNEELKAGEPYIFKSTTGKIELFYGATAVTEPEDVRGMHGWFDAAAPIDPTKSTMLDITEENKSDILYIAQNKLWNCEDLVGIGLEVVNNRAYIVMSEVPTYADYQAAQTSNPAPRRRVTLGRNAEQVATGIEDVQGDKVQCTKILINGQLFILRGEKMYDAKGQLVK